MTTDLILHHYDFSNYSEKARLALGYKALDWCSIIIPPVAPKPDLTPLDRRLPAHAGAAGGRRHLLRYAADPR